MSYALDECYQLFELSDTDEIILGEQIIIDQSNNLVDIADDNFNILSIEVRKFGDLESVIRFFDCNVSFDQFDQRGIFTLYILGLGEGEDLQILTFDDSSMTYIVQGGNISTAIPCTTECVSQFYHNPTIESITAELLVFDSNANVTISDPVFELVSEQVLVRDGYSTVRIIPAQFETVTELVVESYTNICPDYQAEYIQVEEQYLKKESYSILTITPTNMQLYKEEILVSEGYTRYQLETAASTEDFIVEIVPDYTRLDWDLKPNCQSQYPYDCLDHFKVSQAKEFMNLGQPSTWGCPDDGQITYLTKEVVPTSYGIRPYMRLVWPSSTESEIVPTEYITRTYTDIVNRDSIPEECIEIAYATISHQRLASPATSTLENVPALYKTRSYLKLVSDGSATYSEANILCDYSYDREIVIQPFEESLDSFYCDELTLKQQMDIIDCLEDIEYIDGQVTFGSGEFWNAMFHLLSDWDEFFIGPFTGGIIQYFEKP